MVTEKKKNLNSPSTARPQLFTVYDPPGDEGISFEILDPKTGELIPEPSMTEQSHKDSCDVNFLMQKYERTGELPNMIAQDPLWGDFTEVPTYHEALNIVHQADAQFAALDAPIRKRFNNDPATFLEFCTDPKNLLEMSKLGLLTPQAKARLEAEQLLIDADRPPLNSSPAPAPAPTAGNAPPNK